MAYPTLLITKYLNGPLKDKGLFHSNSNALKNVSNRKLREIFTYKIKDSFNFNEYVMYFDPWTSIFKSHIVYFQCVRSFPKSHIFQLLIFARVSFPYDRLRIRVKRAGANICMCRPAHGLTENPCVACRHREIETNRSSKSYACDRCIADITKLIRIGK